MTFNLSRKGGLPRHPRSAAGDCFVTRSLSLSRFAAVTSHERGPTDSTTVD